MTVAFFGISGLEILDAVDQLKDDRKNIIEWIYDLQISPNEEGRPYESVDPMLTKNLGRLVETNFNYTFSGKTLVYIF